MKYITRRQALGWTLAVLCISIAAVCSLVWASGILRDSRGSFLRMLPPHPVEELDSINIRSYNYYFAGAEGSDVYLAAYSNQFHLLKVNALSLDTQHINLNYRGIDTVKFYSPRLKVQGTNFYMVDGAVPAIYQGRLSDKVGASLKSDSIYFLEITPLSTGSFAVKSLSGKTGENILGKIASYAPYWKQGQNILVKQRDGVFCTDGVLSFNEANNQLVYVYYYRNEFIVMDTSLAVRYKRATIDTVSVVKIVPAEISSEGSKTLASPDYVVNRMQRTDGQWIFIESEHLGKNEHKNALSQASVIDMYALKDGRYKFSFYIYHLRGKRKMDDFIVAGDRILVKYGNVLQAFRMKEDYFNYKTIDD